MALTKVVRTLPRIFPVVTHREVRPFGLWKSSLVRRLAMAQNYLWANLRRIYANGAYEGAGSFQHHTGTAQYQGGGVSDSLGDADAREEIIAGQRCLPLVSFYCPPNWCASGRVKIQGRGTIVSTSGLTGQAWSAWVYELDGRNTGIYEFAGPFTGAGTNNWSLEINVPQDKAYQIRVFQIFSSGTPGEEANTLNESVQTFHVSARYAEANAGELHGDTPVTTWTGIHENVATDNYPVTTAVLNRLIQNTNHLFCHRNPELCQSWIADNWSNTSTWKEVGRYVIYLPDKVSKVDGQMVFNCTHGGAGNEVRWSIDGSVQETFTALAAGETVQELTEATGLAAGEHTITIEAKSSAASADWGTRVYGVSLWESGVSTYLPTGMSAPTAFQPLDEAGLEGDDICTDQNNAFAQQSGLRRLIQNDAWLFRNRLRCLIGDWRHRTYKRGAIYTGTWNTIFDPKGDWTPGSRYAYQPFAEKNITVRGSDAVLSATHDNHDGYGGYQYGAPTTITGWQETPYYYPYDLVYPQHGRRLGRYRLVRPTGMSGHINAQTGYVCHIRGRRSRVAELAMDSNGWGPGVAEPKHVNRHFLDVDYNGTRTDHFILGRFGTYGTAQDYERHWLISTPYGAHDNADSVFQVRGRQAPLAYYTGPTASGAPAGTPIFAKEGMMCETEVNTIYLADEPFNQEALSNL